MRTTVNIDDRLLRDAREVAGAHSQSDLINRALAALIREARRKDLLDWVQHGKTKLSPEKLEELRRPRGPRAR
ncbi:MAG: type II toxin-antitoxin system VapB family antitoxin [Myxococcota bacterium]